MFDEKQLEQYRSITAPQALKERVMAQEGKSKKIISFPRKVLSIAACIAVVIVAGVMLGVDNVNVTLSPVSTASMSKSTETVFMLCVDTKGDTVITVSGGTIRCENSTDFCEQIEISSDTCIEWVIGNDSSYILTAKRGIGTKQYSLSYNEQIENWEFAEVK